MKSVQQVIDEARTWVGVPYRHQGRNRLGIDCIGLAIIIARDLSLIPASFDHKAYGRTPTDGTLVMEIAKHCTQVQVAEPGTLVVIRWRRDPYHIAICTGPTLIHASASVGRVVEHGYRHPWPGLTVSIWRMPEVGYV